MKLTEDDIKFHLGQNETLCVEVPWEGKIHCLLFLPIAVSKKFDEIILIRSSTYREIIVWGDTFNHNLNHIENFIKLLKSKEEFKEAKAVLEAMAAPTAKKLYQEYLKNI